MLRKADRWTETDVHPDSAMIYYTVVANRYRDDAPKEEKAEAFRGWYGRWKVAFFDYNDYSGAMDDLITAEEIAEEAGLPMAKVNYAHGCIWAALATQTDDVDTALADKSFGYMTQAFDQACKENDAATALDAFLNLSVSGWVSGRLRTHELPQAAGLRNLKMTDSWKRDAALVGYEAYRALARDSMERSAAHFSRLLDVLPQEGARRERVMALLIRGQLRGELGDYSAGLRDIDSALAISYAANLPDARLVALRGLADIYAAMGNDTGRREATSHILHLQDSLHTARFLLKAEQVNLDRETRMIQKKLIEAETKRKMMSRFMIAAGVVIVVILLLLTILLRTNAKLRERNLALFRSIRSGTSKESNPIPETSAAGTGAGTTKYVTSGLSDAEAERIAAGIESVMRRGEEVFSEDFSLQKLSELVDSNPRYVSQTINQRFGCNYTRLVSRTRIDEACRRLIDNRRYGHFSVEGIAQSVGFSSRSTFYDTFKKITGLTVGEFRKIAQKEAQNADN